MGNAIASSWRVKFWKSKAGAFPRNTTSKTPAPTGNTRRFSFLLPTSGAWPAVAFPHNSNTAKKYSGSKKTILIRLMVLVTVHSQTGLECRLHRAANNGQYPWDSQIDRQSVMRNQAFRLCPRLTIRRLDFTLLLLSFLSTSLLSRPVVLRWPSIPKTTQPTGISVV